MYVWIDYKQTQSCTLVVWVAHLWFELHTFVGCIFWVSLAGHFALPDSESRTRWILFFSRSSHVWVCISYPRWTLAKRPMGWLTSLLWANAPPFLTSKEPFCICVVGKVFLMWRMMNMWSFIWAGLNSSLTSAILDYLSTGDKLQLLSLGPICVLPQILL